MKFETKLLYKLLHAIIFVVPEVEAIIVGGEVTAEVESRSRTTFLWNTFHFIFANEMKLN